MDQYNPMCDECNWHYTRHSSHTHSNMNALHLQLYHCISACAAVLCARAPRVDHSASGSGSRSCSRYSYLSRRLRSLDAIRDCIPREPRKHSMRRGRPDLDVSSTSCTVLWHLKALRLYAFLGIFHTFCHCTVPLWLRGVGLPSPYCRAHPLARPQACVSLPRTFASPSLLFSA